MSKAKKPKAKKLDSRVLVRITNARTRHYQPLIGQKAIAYRRNDGSLWEILRLSPLAMKKIGGHSRYISTSFTEFDILRDTTYDDFS